MPPAVALLNYISCVVYFGRFFAKLGHFAGFFLYMSLMSQDTPPNCVFTVFAGFFYILFAGKISEAAMCGTEEVGDIIFHSIGRPEIIQ
jgi:hypothetical protein